MVKKTVSVLINLIQGAAAVLAAAVFWAFCFERDNPDHDTAIGVTVLILWLFVLILPNCLITLGAKFRKRDILLYQVLPFISGAAAYIIFQLNY